MSPVRTQNLKVRPQKCRTTDLYQNIIFDLGDVLFTWSPAKKLAISPRHLKAIRLSSVWFEYEKGRISQEECYSLAAAEFGLDIQDIRTAAHAAHGSLRPDKTMVSLIRDLKSSGRYRIYAMSNISAPDYAVLKTKADQATWNLFDHIFTSADAGERKPNLGYFKHVISRTGIDPRRTIFIDDKTENVLTARSLGMYGLIFDGFESFSRQLHSLCNDTVAMALEYLENNRKKLVSVTTNDDVLQENFTQLLILEATGDRRLVDVRMTYPHFNFFKEQCATKNFPDDVDTTSIGFTVIPDIDYQTKQAVMDEILTLRNGDGIVQVYFDPYRPRLDPIVCINALTLFYTNDRGFELDSTLEWCYDVLIHRAYIDGTLYYATAEAFLFFLSRLMETSAYVWTKFEAPFAARLSERVGVEGDALALSMRILAGAVVGIRDTVDYHKLRGMQESDGSWAVGWFYKHESSKLLTGNKGLTTALALKAVRTLEDVEDMESVPTLLEG